MKILAVVLAIAIGCNAIPRKDTLRKFPKDFIFGTATASYQIEGAWDTDGKGESIWDHMTHNTPEVITDKSNGDIGPDSYHNYKRDVEMLRELGLDAYRFSLSWSRILPKGTPDHINQPGLDYYNNLINEMLTYNITPIITLYHWDLPQRLQEYGGFMNPLFGEWFEDYTRIAFENFGDRVKHWITFNEPREICYEGYGFTTKAPMLNYSGVGEYICAKNLVTGHARAWHVYNDEFRSKQEGVIGITISVNWSGPHTDSEQDEMAAELKRQIEWGIYADPIFSENGGFPKELFQRVAKKSAEQGYLRSRLPEFTESEKNYIRGASDFFGVNHYTASLVSATEELGTWPVPSSQDDVNVGIIDPEEWLPSASSWLKQVPNSIFNVLSHLHSKYNTVYYITENGFSSNGGLIDDDRVSYYRAALESVLDVLDAGIPLKGYMAWSLMDNFEWTQGYTERFGIYEVDYEDTARTRTPRKSAFVYKQIVKSRVVDPTYEPDTWTMTIDNS